MKLSEDRGFKTLRYSVNQQLIADDKMREGYTDYENMTDLLAMIGNYGVEDGTGADRIISGLLLEFDSVLSSDLRTGVAVSYTGEYYLDGSWGFSSEAGKPFAVFLDEDAVVTVASGGAQARYDTIEIRPQRVSYDTEARVFKDPITGATTSSNVATKQEYTAEVQILQGTEGAGVAPTHTAGWIKVAEVFVDASASSIDQGDIKDVRDSDTWTTEADGTRYRKEMNIVYEDLTVHGDILPGGTHDIGSSSNSWTFGYFTYLYANTVGLNDSGYAVDMYATPASLTNNRSLEIDVNDASRFLRIYGDTYISQDYRTSASPQFAGMTLTGTLDMNGGALDLAGLGTTQVTDGFYKGTTDPVAGSRVNLDSYLHVTELTSHGNIVISGGRLDMSSLDTTPNAGYFYGGTTNPSNTTRLNYDGEFHAEVLHAYGSSYVTTADRGTGYGVGTLNLEAEDASLEIASSDAATWGSGIAFTQTDATVFENKWGIIRQTDGDGDGDGTLHFTYGTSTSLSGNTSYLSLTVAGVLTAAGGVTATAGQVLAPFTTATAPGFGFSGDSNTGIYRVNENILGIATAGSGRLATSNTATYPITDAGIDLGISGTNDFNNVYAENIFAGTGLTVGAKSGAISALEVKDATDNSATDVDDYTGGLGIRNNVSTIGTYSILKLYTWADGDFAYVMGYAANSNNVETRIGRYYTSGGTVNDHLIITNIGDVTPGASGTQDLGASSTRWDHIFANELYLHEGSHYMILDVAADLTANRTLTLDLNNANRTVYISGNSYINQDLRTTSTVTEFSRLGVGEEPDSHKLRVYDNNSVITDTAGLVIEQDGTGDAMLHFELTGGQIFAMGIDNSDSDIFKISPDGGVAHSTLMLQFLTTGEFIVGNNHVGSAKMAVMQGGLLGAVPVLGLRQNDNDMEFIYFYGNASSGDLTRCLVDEGDQASETREGWIKVYVYDQGNQITDGTYYVPVYSLSS